MESIGAESWRERLLTLPSARTVIEAVMGFKEEPKLKACIAIWLCWSERNRVREEQGHDPAWIVHSILVRIVEWSQQVREGARPQAAAPQKWQRPGTDYIKANCDAAFDPGTGNGGWGCILRDSDGDLIKACRGRIPTLMNPMHGELIACIQGVQAAIDAGVGHLQANK
jgi:hypothetical protein